MKHRFFTALAVTTLLPSALQAIKPYSAGTVGTLNSSANGQLLHRSDISNPSQGLVLTPTVIGDGAVGRNGVATATARLFWQVAAYRVSDLLAAIGSTDPADLADFTFTYSGVAEAATTLLPAANKYRAAYLGQWEDTGLATTDVPLRGAAANANNQNMTDTTDGAADAQRTLFGTAIESISGFATAHPAQQIVALDVEDQASAAQKLVANGFDLTHLATDLAEDSDLSNNFVFFSFYLEPKLPTGAALTQCFTSVTLIPVEKVDPKSIDAGLFEVAGPNQTGAWGFENLNHSGGTIRFEIDGNGPDQLFVLGDYAHTVGDLAVGLFVRPVIGTPVPLLHYGGSLTGTPSFTLEPGTRYSLDSTTLGDGSDDAVSATFAGAGAALHWVGDAGDTWDLIGAENWLDDVTPEKFHNLDEVTFDDLATSYAPALAATLYPSAVTFENSTNEYTLNGPGAIAGSAKLRHTGTGKVTVLANNTNSGGAEVTDLDGILQVGNGGTSGAIGSGPVVLTGELILNRSDDVVFANAVAGTNGLFSQQGAGRVTLTANHTGTMSYAVNTGTLRVGNGGATGSLTATANVEIGADGTLEYLRSNAAVSVGASFAGSGKLMFKGTGVSGQSSYELFGNTIDFDGPVVIEGARVWVNNNTNDLGVASAITVRDNGSLYLTTAGGFDYPLSIEGDGWLEAAGQLGAVRLESGVSLTGPVTLTNDARITAWGSSGAIIGDIGDGGGGHTLELLNGHTVVDSTIVLAGNNSHSGGTIVRGLTANAESAAAFGSGPVTVEAHPADPARLSQVLFSAVTVNNDITAHADTSVTGTGGTTGTLTLAGGALAPGASVGSLSAGSLVIQSGGTYRAEIDSSVPNADLVKVTGAVTLESGAGLSVTDLAAAPATLADGAKFAILDYTGGSLTGAFAGLAPGATLTVGPNTFAINYADTSDGLGGSGLFVTLTVTTATTPYQDWSTDAGIPGEPFDGDFDNDGIANGLEWILGGDPKAQDAASLVTVSATPAGGLTLAFTRADASFGEATLVVEWSANLAPPWTAVPVGAGSSNEANGVVVTVIDTSDPDQITVNIPASNAPNGRLFARLKATMP